MVDDLLTDLFEPGIFGQNRNKPVHLSVDLDAFDHLFAVGLEHAVEVVQLDSRSQPGRSVEKFAGQCFPDRIVAPFFPAAHQIVAFFGDHSVEFRNLVRRVLQVGVHRDYDIALCRFESAVEPRRFAVVALEPDGAYGWILLSQRSDNLP